MQMCILIVEMWTHEDICIVGFVVIKILNGSTLNG